MTKGLYFYKFVSPYEEDITKDCKLTINEIDSNFFNLKNADIKDASLEVDTKRITLERNNGEELILELSKINKLDVDYNSIDGIIEIKYDNEKFVIKDLITRDNLSKEILTKVYSDATLDGSGTNNHPLSIASVQKTGSYKPVIKILNSKLHEILPSKGMAKGDRYVTLEEVNNFGLLYNFDSVLKINHLLRKTGWRVATKNDWDNMLNAIEPCEYRDHSSTLNNRVLGKLAGSLLKSTYGWSMFRKPFDDDKKHKCDCESYDVFDVDFNKCSDNKDFHHHVDKDFSCHYDKVFPHHPESKKFNPDGKDAYNMTILPTGCAYFAHPIQYAQFGFQGAYWTSDTIFDTDVYAKVFVGDESGVLQIGERPSAFLSIRLVKDYNGSNHNSIENILGDNYKTVLMPSLDNSNGYAIWTAQNFRLRIHDLKALLPNDGINVKPDHLYYINEWNGFSWDKIQMEEGDTVVILNGQRWNEEYRIIKGRLVNVTDTVVENVRSEVKYDIADLRKRLNEANDHICSNSRKIVELRKITSEELENTKNELNERIDKLDEKFDSRCEVLEQKDEELKQEIDENRIDLNSLKEDFDKQVEKHNNDIRDIQQELDSLHTIDDDFKGRIGDLEETMINVEETLIVQEGSKYDETTGILTLKSKNGKSDIDVQFGFNFGTF